MRPVETNKCVEMAWIRIYEGKRWGGRERETLSYKVFG